MAMKERRPSIGDAVLAGIVASLVYTVVAQTIVIAVYGPSAFFKPFQQIAAVAAGPTALTNDYDLTTATALGTIVHLSVGVFYALVFLALANLIKLSSTAHLILAGVIYGALIYALNRYVIFPHWFPWFLENSAGLQVALHALAFGGVIGWWLSRSAGGTSLREAP
jgi:hypothetical protein